MITGDCHTKQSKNLEDDWLGLHSEMAPKQYNAPCTQFQLHQLAIYLCQVSMKAAYSSDGLWIYINKAYLYSA